MVNGAYSKSQNALEIKVMNLYHYFLFFIFYFFLFSCFLFIFNLYFYLFYNFYLLLFFNQFLLIYFIYMHFLSFPLQKLLFIFLEWRDSFFRALLYLYELPPFFSPQTLTIVFYKRNTLGMMIINLYHYSLIIENKKRSIMHKTN